MLLSLLADPWPPAPPDAAGESFRHQYTTAHGPVAMFILGDCRGSDRFYRRVHPHGLQFASSVSKSRMATVLARPNENPRPDEAGVAFDGPNSAT